jgi:1,4-dihydroxy-2-naphthoate octaprenyltransferase
MKWEVKLYQGGSVFTEEVYANDYQDAKRTAQARNPTVKIIGCNPIVGDRHSNTNDDDDDDYSSNQSSSSSSSHSVGDSMGTVMLLGALLLIGVIVTYWYIVIPVGLIIGILCYFGNKD